MYIDEDKDPDVDNTSPPIEEAPSPSTSHPFSIANISPFDVLSDIELPELTPAEIKQNKEIADKQAALEVLRQKNEIKLQAELQKEAEVEAKQMADTLNADKPPPDFSESQTVFFPREFEQNASGFSPENVKTIYNHIKLGMNLTDCAKLLRLPSARLHSWYNNNYCNFRFMVDEAQATNKLIHVGRVTTAKSLLEVKASTWMLERRYKEEYTKETIVTVNHLMIDNIARVTAETLIKYIKDPDTLQLATSELRQRLSLLTPQVDDNKLAIKD